MTVAAPEVHVLMGLKFAIVDTTPFGDAVLSPSDNLCWEVSAETWERLSQRSNGMKHGVVQMIRNAQSGGERLVKGIVQPGARRGQVVAQRPRRSNIDGLAERARGLMVQIATLSDAGPIPDGQMKEITKTYASLQTELDEVKGALAEIEENLSIGRAIIFEYTMPS